MKFIGGSQILVLVLTLCLANHPDRATISMGQDPPNGGHASEAPEQSTDGTQDHKSSEFPWSKDAPDYHAARTEARSWSDEQLRAAIEKTQLGQESELLLLEVVHRGGQRWMEYLANRHDALMRFSDQPPADYDDIVSLTISSNLHLLTALRRVQKKPDPLRILVAGKLNLSYTLNQRPLFRILIVNLDEEKEAVLGFTVGGNDRSGRLARWRIEVRDEEGKMLPVKRIFAAMRGGISTFQGLEYFESWHTTLPLENYVEIEAPGNYTMRILYHNDVAIVDRGDIEHRIVSRSPEMKLQVRPLSVSVTNAEREAARRWIAELPNSGPVKMMIGIIESPEFLNPTSPPGRLQSMYTSAVPDLIDAALDPMLEPGKRAWVLGILFAITGHNDPRHVRESLFSPNEIIGAYEYCGAGKGAVSGGRVDPVKQWAFAVRWRVWKEESYYVIRSE